MGRDQSQPDDARREAVGSLAREVPAACLSADAVPADAVPMHDIHAELAALAAHAQAGAADRAWSLSIAELRAAVVAGARLKAALDSAWLGLVKALDDRDEPPGARHFLTDALRLPPGQAAADVEAAHTLAADTGALPGVGSALRNGEITRAHADAAVRVARDLPKRLATAIDPESGLTGMAAADAFLAEQSRSQSPRTVAWLGEQLLARLAPDRRDRHDPDAVLRRTASRAWDSTGMLRGSFQMDGAAGAAFAAVWDELSAPDPAGAAVDDQGQQPLIRDDRPVGVRRVDALSAMARLAAAQLGSGGGSMEGHRDGPSTPAAIAVSATVEQVAALSEGAEVGGMAQQHTGQRGPISAWLLGRLACDALLQRVVLAPGGAVLDLGRRVRLATPGQRRALSVRDGGCVIPGCPAPPGHCDAHHVVEWSRGGRTGLSNLALLCPRHHTAVHARHWGIELRGGVVWAIPPTWVDPSRTALRNTTHQTARTAHRLGDQLRLMLDDLPGP